MDPEGKFSKVTESAKMLPDGENIIQLMETLKRFDRFGA